MLDVWAYLFGTRGDSRNSYPNNWSLVQSMYLHFWAFIYTCCSSVWLHVIISFRFVSLNLFLSVRVWNVFLVSKAGGFIGSLIQISKEIVKFNILHNVIVSLYVMLYESVYLMYINICYTGYTLHDFSLNLANMLKWILSSIAYWNLKLCDAKRNVTFMFIKASIISKVFQAHLKT